MAPGVERKWKLSPGIFAAKWKEAPNQGLGGSDKGQVLGSDLQVRTFDFPN